MKGTVGPMQAWTGGLLALAALGAGWWIGGWSGGVLAVTVIVFWLLLQWGQVLRVLRQAAANPVGQVDSAVMLHSRLRAGLNLGQVLRLTRSLGQRLDSTEAGLEGFEWADAGGVRVQVWLRTGRVQRWELLRGPQA